MTDTTYHCAKCEGRDDLPKHAIRCPLRTGEDPTPRDENAWPTPGQFIREWNAMTPEGRLDAAEKITQGAQNHLDLLTQIATLREPTIAHYRERAEAAEAAARALEAVAAGYKATARDVVTDYAETCCDDLPGCACSMARLARLAGVEEGA